MNTAAIILYFIQSVLIIGVGLGTRSVLRDAAASARMAVWAIVAIALVISPILMLFGFGISIDFPLSGSTDVARFGERGMPPAGGGNWFDPAIFFAAAYLSGFVFIGGRELTRHLRIYAAKKNAFQVRDGRIFHISAEAHRALGLKREVAFFLVEGLPVPVCVGLFRPAILLPADANRWSLELLVSTIRHELVHVRRRDNQFGAIAVAISSLNWFNPLAWLAFRRYCEDREEACDAGVIASGLNAADYAASIVAFAAENRRNEPIPAGMAALSGVASFKHRIKAVLKCGVRSRRLSPLVLTTLASLLTFSFGIASIKTVSEVRPDEANKIQSNYEESGQESPLASAFEGFVDGMTELISGKVSRGSGEEQGDLSENDDQIVIRKVIVR